MCTTACTTDSRESFSTSGIERSSAPQAVEDGGIFDGIVVQSAAPVVGGAETVDFAFVSPNREDTSSSTSTREAFATFSCENHVR